MFVRTVTASFDVSLADELADFGESVKDQIASFPGLREWRFVADVETGRAVPSRRSMTRRHSSSRGRTLMRSWPIWDGSSWIAQSRSSGMWSCRCDGTVVNLTSGRSR